MVSKLRKTLRSGKQDTIFLNLLLLIITPIILLLILEVGTRIFLGIFFQRQMQEDIWKLDYEPYVLYYSRSGLKNRDVYKKYPPKNDNCRILILGGSTAAQMPNNLVKDAAQKVLKKPVEVINFADGGYIINQALIMLTLYGVDLKPDLVISIDGFNDIAGYTKGMEPGINYHANYIRYAVENPVTNGLRALVNKSHFIQAAVKYTERKAERENINNREKWPQTLEHYIDTTQKMAKLSQTMGAEFRAVLQPYVFCRKSITDREKEFFPGFKFRRPFMIWAFQSLEQGLNQAEFNPGVKFISGLSAFDNIKQECFTDVCHLTPEGKRLLMEYIFKQAAGL